MRWVADRSSLRPWPEVYLRQVWVYDMEGREEVYRSGSEDQRAHICFLTDQTSI